MMSLSLCVPLESVSKARNQKLKGEEEEKKRAGDERAPTGPSGLIILIISPLSAFLKKEAIKGCPFGLIWLKKQDGGRDERLQMSVLIRGVKTAICELGRLLKWVESARSASVCVFFKMRFSSLQNTSFLQPLLINSLSKPPLPPPCLIGRRAL